MSSAYSFFTVSEKKFSILSGLFTGASTPDDGKPSTSWECSINFVPDQEVKANTAGHNDPLLFPYSIQGQGFSEWRSEKIDFHLVGTLNASTREFDLYKTHTGKYSNTIHFVGQLLIQVEPDTQNPHNPNSNIIQNLLTQGGQQQQEQREGEEEEGEGEYEDNDKGLLAKDQREGSGPAIAPGPGPLAFSFSLPMNKGISSGLRTNKDQPKRKLAEGESESECEGEGEGMEFGPSGSRGLQLEGQEKYTKRKNNSPQGYSILIRLIGRYRSGSLTLSRQIKVNGSGEPLSSPGPFSPINHINHTHSILTSKGESADKRTQGQGQEPAKALVNSEAQAEAHSSVQNVDSSYSYSYNTYHNPINDNQSQSHSHNQTPQVQDNNNNNNGNNHSNYNLVSNRIYIDNKIGSNNLDNITCVRNLNNLNKNNPVTT